jgi:16S rRNA (guanine527-N7)-methyltransferase
MISKEIICLDLEQLGLPADDLLAEKLSAFIGDLVKWNKVYNLTAIREPEQILTQHIFDSLSVHPYLTGSRIIDVGTGGGFPGIPLAMLMPKKLFTLLDSNGKKTRFLQQMVINHGQNPLPRGSMSSSVELSRHYLILCPSPGTSSLTRACC